MLRNSKGILILLPLGIIFVGYLLKGNFLMRFNTDTNKNNIENMEKIIIETEEVSISCNKETIQDYTNKGWKIVDSSTSEVPCSWKTIKATKNCNLQRDKGCKITVPDIMGEKTTYTLEKETLVEEILINDSDSKDEIDKQE